MTAVLGAVRPAMAPTLLHLIERIARQRPHAAALRMGEVVWSFERMWRTASAQAGALTECGVERGAVVAVWAERTPSSIVAALAVMMSGAAYLPIDPASPAGRRDAVLSTSGTRLLLADANATVVPPCGIELLDLADASPSGALCGLPAAGDVAYVVFTSGSTGAPKGVQIEHGSLLNYSAWCADLVRRGADGGTGGGSPLFGSLGFDHAMTSYWPTLLRGEAVTMVRGVWDGAALFGSPTPRYSLLKVTPSHLHFLERTMRPDYRATTRMLMSGGEVLTTESIRDLGARVAGLRLVNHYGPSETTIGACHHEFDLSSLPALPTIPIGRPIWNTRAHVVDGSLAPVAPGRAGELVIAGAGVARGYLGGDAGDRFIEESELGAGRGRAYRTGDIVEQLPDGALLYLGRGDDQTKISGYRLELGGVRALALAVPGVKDAAFDAADDGTGRLAGFIIPAPGQDRESLGRRVRAALADQLPAAVVPRRLDMVAAFAVDTNGKRDLAATRHHRWVR